MLRIEARAGSPWFPPRAWCEENFEL